MISSCSKTTRRKPVIAVDLDEVLCHFVPHLAEFINHERPACCSPTSLPLSATDFFSYKFYEVWGGTQEDSDNLMQLFFASRFFIGDENEMNNAPREGVQPIQGAREILQKHLANFEFHVVTSRHTELEDETRRWINIHYPKIFSGVHLGNHYGKSGEMISKPEVCREINAQLLIDDCLQFVQMCGNEDIPTLLFQSYPWNMCDKECLPPKCCRVGGWDEVGRILESINKNGHFLGTM
eukprot:540541_1